MLCSRPVVPPEWSPARTVPVRTVEDLAVWEPLALYDFVKSPEPTMRGEVGRVFRDPPTLDGVADMMGRWVTPSGGYLNKMWPTLASSILVVRGIDRLKHLWDLARQYERLAEPASMEAATLALRYREGYEPWMVSRIRHLVLPDGFVDSWVAEHGLDHLRLVLGARLTRAELLNAQASGVLPDRTVLQVMAALSVGAV